MSDNTEKLCDELGHWKYDKMVAERVKRTAWLESEAAYIRGIIHRSTGIKLGTESKVLQVGAGPDDVIDHWDAAEKHAIDPLANEYKEKFHEFQDKSVKYIAGVGENLPYEDDYFDVVIIRNALDHVDEPDQTLREVYRVLKPNGALYIWMYLYSWQASLAYRAINALTKKFEVEPWAFTLGRIKKCLLRNRFQLRYPAVEEIPVENRSWPKFLSQAWLYLVIKKILGFTGLKGFSCVAVAIK